MVSDAPFFIKPNNGIVPLIIKEVDKKIENYKIKINFLPVKRLLKFFKQKKIKYIVHSPAHFKDPKEEKVLILPIVRLIEKYAYIEPESLKLAKPILGIFQGDEEERSHINKDKYTRIEVSTSESLLNMLENRRLHFINCLKPFCTYFRRNKTPLKYIKKDHGLQESLGGIMVQKDNYDPHELELISKAFEQTIKSASFKEKATHYLKDLNIEYSDIFLNEYPTYRFVDLNTDYIFKY